MVITTANRLRETACFTSEIELLPIGVEAKSCKEWGGKRETGDKKFEMCYVHVSTTHDKCNYTKEKH